MWKAQPTKGDPTYFVLYSRLSNQDGSERPAKPMMQTLPHDIPPGACVELDMEIQAPQRPGRYVLVVDVSRHYVFAFTTLGNPVCEVPVRVG